MLGSRYGIKAFYYVGNPVKPCTPSSRQTARLRCVFLMFCRGRKCFGHAFPTLSACQWIQVPVGCVESEIRKLTVGITCAFPNRCSSHCRGLQRNLLPQAMEGNICAANFTNN